MKQITRRAILPHRLTSGTGMVLLAILWVAGWFTSPHDLFAGTALPLLLASLTALMLAGWNLLGCVIAAGFFHAASTHPAPTFRGFRLASFRLILIGILILFPVPLMTQVLGAIPSGRALALIVTGMSMAAIIFGRARLRVIAERLESLAEEEPEPPKLAPWQ